MLIKKLSIRDLWSIGKSELSLTEFPHITIIIGKNNNGKSNIIEGIRWFKNNGNQLLTRTVIRVPDNIKHDCGKIERVASPKLFLEIAFTTEEINTICSKISPPHLEDFTEIIQESLANCVTLEFDSLWDESQFKNKTMLLYQQTGIDLPPGKPSSISQNIITRWRTLSTHLMQGMINLISSKIIYLSGWRNLDGNMVDTLAGWNIPQGNNKKDKLKFEKIQYLFQNLTKLHTSKLNPNIKDKELYVEWNGKYLNIKNFGDGIQHLLMIAYEIAIRNEHVFLIEEPETHIHPEFQRHLLEIFDKDENNQFIITTHSPVFLNSGKSELFYRVDHNGYETTVTQCDTNADIYDTLDALDVRASDILQANLVIWVEGPTDRMFLKKCFELKEYEFVEGIHYQISYYGGKLLSHFTFDEESCDDLVNLMRLSRNVAVISDSDKDDGNDDIQEYKTKLHDECVKMGGFSWMTNGREIENYISDSVLTSAYKELIPEETIEIKLGQFESISDVLKRSYPKPKHGDGWKVVYSNNKVRVMPKLLKHLTVDDMNQLDLNEKLEELKNHIKKANSIS